MKENILRELVDKKIIDEHQFHRLEKIISKKIISVFYELRTLLYLGVLLFSAGIGLLIYKNIGSIGHIISFLLLCVSTIGCFAYAYKKRQKHSHFKIEVVSPYDDYVLLLGSLLFISVFGYLQFLYHFLDNYLELSTLFTALFFFYIAYRYDHLGILSLAITSFASFWGLSISPQKWHSSHFFSAFHLQNTAIIFSLVLAAIAILLHRQNIKRHFTFSYLNYCSILFFFGCFSGMLYSDALFWLYLLLTIIGSATAIFFGIKTKKFLFLLYGFFFGYIGLTFMLTKTGLFHQPIIGFYYALLSCGGLIVLIVRYKRIFKK